MSDFSKISYYDLKLEAIKNRLPVCIGRDDEIERVSRILSRRLQHHCIISAPSGSGKSAIVLGWARQAVKNKSFGKFNFALFDSSTLQKISQLPASSLNFYQEAFGSLENC